MTIALIFTVLRRFGPKLYRSVLIFALASCVAAVLDLALLTGVLGFARLLMKLAPLGHGPHWLTAPLDQRQSPALTVVAASGLLFALSLIRTGMEGCTEHLRHRMLVPLIRTSARSLYAQQLATPFRALAQRDLARSGALLVTDLRLVVQNVVMPIMTMIPDTIMLLAVLGLLLVMNPLMTTILILTFAGSSLAMLAFDRHVRPSRTPTARDLVPQMLDITHQTFSGIRELRVLRREVNFRRRMRRVAHQYAQAITREHFISILPRLWNENSLFFCLFLLTTAGVLVGGRIEETLPSLALFSAAGWRLLPLGTRMLRAVRQIGEHLPIARSLVVQWQSPAGGPPATAGAGCPVERPFFTQSIRLRGLTCGLTEDAPVVAGLDADIQQGEMVAIAGASGIGKTTLLDTLVGLLDPLGGQIEIDGRPLAAVRAAWQRSIGYVPQDAYLANASLRENIAWGLDRDRVADTRIAEVLAEVGLTDFVSRLPDGLHTQIGERGTRLSGGQRQRVAIARALLSDPAVLVLDEATSQLDVATERALLERLRARAAGRTIILATHRPETAAACDRVIDLSQAAAHAV